MTVILTLESHALMEFKRAKVKRDGFHPKNQKESSQVEDGEITQVLMEPRSLVLITGDARWNYLHQVVQNNSFEFEGKEYHRDRRISLVLGSK